MTEFLTPGGPYLYSPPTGFNCFDIECWGTDTEFEEYTFSEVFHPGGLVQGGYIKMRLGGLTSNMSIDVGDQSGTGEYAGGVGTWTYGAATQADGPKVNGGGGSGVRLFGSPDPLIVAGGAGGCVLPVISLRVLNYSTPGGVGGASTGGNGINSESVDPSHGGTQTEGGVAGLNGESLLPGRPPGPFFLERPGSSGSYKIGGGGPITQPNTLLFGGFTIGGGGGFYGGGSGHTTAFLFPDFNNGIARGDLFCSGAGGSNGSVLPTGVFKIGNIISLQGGTGIPQNPNQIVGVNGLRRNGAVRITPVGWISTISPIPETYIVPDCIYQLQAQLWGGNGGPSTNLDKAALGGCCEAMIDVVPGTSLDLYVGQSGGMGIPGLSPNNLTNGGESGSNSVGGGGAGTAIVYQNIPILIAGGAGGSSQDYQGGQGGGVSGANGGGSTTSGKGGGPLAPGAGGASSINNGAPGVGMIGGGGANSIFDSTSGGGGGGGGHFGGGGGGTKASLDALIGDGAGGGGSSAFNSSLLPISMFHTGGNIGLTPNPDPAGHGFILIIPGACVCVAEGTLVNTEYGQIPIEHIQPGQLVQSSERWVRVQRNVSMLHNPGKMVYCRGSCFDWGSPSDAGLMISNTHPMLIDGIETTGGELCQQGHHGIDMVRTEGRVKVYTLITQNRDFVRMNNTLVGTWGEDSWNNFITNDSLGLIVRGQI